MHCSKRQKENRITSLESMVTDVFTAKKLSYIVNKFRDILATSIFCISTKSIIFYFLTVESFSGHISGNMEGKQKE